MKKILLTICLAGLVLSGLAQVAKDYTIQVKTIVQSSPSPKITFQWVKDNNATSYAIDRKTKTASSWTSVATGLAGSTTQWSDATVTIGSAYEYKISKVSSVNAESYVYAGIELPVVEDRGKIILLVDDSFTTSLKTELTRLYNDLVADGWKIIRHDISRATAVTTVRNLVIADYSSDPTNVKSVFIIGHVPVPYSGEIRPDGHYEHWGAWPADLYYADMTGTWTDASVNSSVASRNANKNIPGDGKFDQNIMPAFLKLQIGRVDFYDMPSFTASETELLRKYLNKDHNYRTKKFTVRERVLIDDNFGAFSGEAFASNGWRLSSIVNADSIVEKDYFTTLSTENYQWACAIGPGTYTTCGGVGATSDYAADSVRAIFNMAFGSYFGDWDNSDNFLRASLASGSVLTNAWTGRPHWHFHHMGLGEPIGYSAFASMNNYINVYVANYSKYGVHQALLGDPTLRMHIIAPPTNFTAVAASKSVALTWTASSDAVLGYYVYRYDSTSSTYKRITTSMITGTNYVDTKPPYTVNTYLLRAIRLEQSASGSYYNMSTGVYSNVPVITSSENVANEMSTMTLIPNPAVSGNSKIQVYNLINEDALVEVYDMQGRLLTSQSLALTVGKNIFPVSLDASNKGMYLVKLQTQSGKILNAKLLVE